MQLYPAIDIKEGKCVRLSQGHFDHVTVYSEDPVKMAWTWVLQGAGYLHLVDLDGALSGTSENASVIQAVLRQVSVPVQIGGGIRSREAVAAALELGAARVIIGTKAVEDPLFIQDMLKEFGAERIVVGVDAKDGVAAVEGWERLSSLSVLDLCQRMKSYGVRHIVYTDISRDGMLSGPNVAAAEALTKDTGLDIIASGGVSSMADLGRLYDYGIGGAVIGKALYEKKIDLAEAVSRFERAHL